MLRLYCVAYLRLFCGFDISGFAGFGGLLVLFVFCFVVCLDGVLLVCLVICDLIFGFC